ncbi:MAG: putative metal-binding motif-containing protein [Deltaproteobacteria bacterium]|nr:putative metal-binding motif-containing protein [Deltaproteobacteria bacterium]
MGLFGVAAACAASGEDTGPGTGGASSCGTEICGDGLDNDCDGIADEDCPCNQGEEQECYTGSPTSVNLGVCRTGTQECSPNNTWGACTGDIVPSEEICDGLDNDCDGTVDNGCTPGTGGSGGGYSQGDFAGGADRFEYDDVALPFAAQGDQQVTLRIDFTWKHVATRPPPFDLAVRLAGVAGSLAQVFSVDGRPFVRIGTRAVPLTAGVSYRVEVARTDTTVVTRVVSLADDTIVLSGPEREFLGRSGDTLTLVTPSHTPRVKLGELSTLRTPTSASR